MDNRLKIAQQQLLLKAELDDNKLSCIFDKLLSRKMDSADLYFQAKISESWHLENTIVQSGHYGNEAGVGVRAISGEKTGFAYANEIHYSALEHAADAVRTISHQGGNLSVAAWRTENIPQLYLPNNPLLECSDQEKVDLLRQLDMAARKVDPRIVQVMATLSAAFETVLIIDDAGCMAADVRPMVRCNVTAIADNGKGRTEQGYAGAGGRYTYQQLFIDNQVLDLAEEAARQALINLDAVAAPAGIMSVVLGPGWPGILLHEAVGHGLEGDFNRKGTSAFAGRIGERVASPLCTVVDDGTIVGQRGSLNIDDEGTVTQRTVLIEKGILKGYMQDKLNARLMNTTPTGNGRRESYAHLPLPRMTNTFMLAGTTPAEEIIASVEKGLYAVNFSGGQVDITSGQFVFAANEAYLIERGRITKPVKGATLIGNGPQILTKVSMVGNDLALDKGMGVCGKEGQHVPVSVGQPTLKIDEITVGGTQN